VTGDLAERGGENPTPHAKVDAEHKRGKEKHGSHRRAWRAPSAGVWLPLIAAAVLLVLALLALVMRPTLR
jgi:hypothetical protein